MSINSNDFYDRLLAGKEKEQQLVSCLNNNAWTYNEAVYSVFFAGSEKTDQLEKVDAFCYGTSLEDREHISISAQLKIREKFNDVGLAFIRPFTSVPKLKTDYQNGTISYDRDFLGKSDVTITRTVDHIIWIDTMRLKYIASTLLDDWMAGEGSFKNRSFISNNHSGAGLRVVDDMGSGYTQGEKKIICYVTPRVCKLFGGLVCKIDDLNLLG